MESALHFFFRIRNAIFLYLLLKQKTIISKVFCLKSKVVLNIFSAPLQSHCSKKQDNFFHGIICVSTMRPTGRTTVPSKSFFVVRG
jgi:hypothetical protein